MAGALTAGGLGHPGGLLVTGGLGAMVTAPPLGRSNGVLTPRVVVHSFKVGAYTTAASVPVTVGAVVAPVGLVTQQDRRPVPVAYAPATAKVTQKPTPRPAGATQAAAPHAGAVDGDGGTVTATSIPKTAKGTT